MQITRKRLTQLIIATCISTAVSADEKRPPPRDETKEPPLEFDVTIDGKIIRVLNGAPIEVEIAGKKSRLVIHARPTRTFRTNEIEFHYPATYSFEFEQYPSLTSWSVGGNDCLALVFRSEGQELRGEGDAVALMNLVISKAANFLNKFDSEREVIVQTLQGKRIEGTRFVIDFGDDIKIWQDYFPIRTKEHVYIIMIQDSLSDDGKRSTEARDFLSLLERTFRILETSKLQPDPNKK